MSYSTMEDIIIRGTCNFYEITVVTEEGSLKLSSYGKGLEDALETSALGQMLKDGFEATFAAIAFVALEDVIVPMTASVAAFIAQNKEAREKFGIQNLDRGLVRVILNHLAHTLQVDLCRIAPKPKIKKNGKCHKCEEENCPIREMPDQSMMN